MGTIYPPCLTGLVTNNIVEQELPHVKNISYSHMISYDIDMYFVFYGLHDRTLQICIIPLYECFVNIITI